MEVKAGRRFGLQGPRWPLVAATAGWLGIVGWVSGPAWPLALPVVVRISLVAVPAALLLAGAVAARGGAAASADRHPLLFESTTLWRWGLFATACSVAVLYVIIGQRAEGNQRPDAAYYFGVARHMATSGRFEEPIIWHFLTPPETIAHRPFDYWGPLTSLSLLPFLRFFGATHEVGLSAMALYAALSVLAFAYLVGRAAAIRGAPLQLLALVAFALAPAVHSYRFDTESIALFQLILILGLIAFAREHDAAAMLCSFLLVLCRAGAGSVFCAVVWSMCLARILRGPPAGRGRRLRAAGCAAGASVLIYLLFNLVAFAAPLPPAARLAPLLGDPLDLLTYTADRAGPSAEWPARLSPGLLLARAKQTAQALARTDFLPVQGLWLLLAALSGIVPSRLRAGLAGLVWLLLFPGSFLIAFATHAVYSERDPLLCLPLFVLAGVFGLEVLTERPCIRRAAPRLAWTVALCALGYACATGIRGYGERGPAWRGTPSLAHLAPTLAGEAVASELPYFVIAETDSPAVTLPLNGEPAVDAVLRRYGVRWLLLFGTDFASPDTPTETLVTEILAGRRTRLGSFGLRHVRTRPDEWVLFRLEPVPSQ